MRIVLAPLLVIGFSGGLDALIVECRRNSEIPHPRGPHCKDTANNRRGIFINDEMMLVLRVPLIAVGGICTHEFSRLRASLFYRPHLLTGVTAVKLVE